MVFSTLSKAPYWRGRKNKLFCVLDAYYRLHYGPPGGGGGGLLPYISYIGMYRPKVYGFWAGLKTGIDLAHYSLKSGMVFKGTTRAYKRILSFQLQMN